MDSAFYKLLAATNQLATRKRQLRRKVYALVGVIVFPVIGAALLPLAWVHGLVWLLATMGAGGAICFAIAERYARPRMRQLAEQVASETGFTVDQLMAEAKHIDSALPG